jgi:predicted ArsR family transcriptional regulator
MSAMATDLTGAKPAADAAVHDVAVAPPLPAGRRAVLYAVRGRGDATVEQVAEDLDITESGARQHLRALADDGLVGLVEVPRGAGERGRPQHTYHVSELGDALFPKAYSALTNELLGYLEDEDPTTIARLFTRRRQHRIDAARARLARHRSLAARVEELAAILDGDGYLATAEQVDRNTFRVVEHNCAIAQIARRHGEACTSEIEFIRAVLPDTTVERVHHMVAGDRHCAYLIRRR